jgi:hypothetical protein
VCEKAVHEISSTVQSKPSLGARVKTPDAGGFKFDDSLDAFGVHGVSGALGAVLVGVFAIRPVMGGREQFMKQAVGLGITALFAFVATDVIALAIHKTLGLRVTSRKKSTGWKSAFTASVATTSRTTCSATPRTPTKVTPTPAAPPRLAPWPA